METSPFQQAGEVCENCRPHWEKAGKPPVELVALPKTPKYSKEVAVCPYCDGPVYDIAVAARKRDAA